VASLKRTTRAAFLLVVVLAATASAQPPMGPPMAVLEERQWAFGAEYGHREADFKAHGTYVERLDGADPASAFERGTIDDLTSHVIFARLSYGICDNWDVFVRLGLADARDDMSLQTTPDTSSSTALTYDGSHGFAYGFGTRATFCRWGPWTFGGLAQATWLQPDSDDYIYRDPGASNTVSIGRMSIDAWEAQVALAAVYQIDTLHFWTGPFLQFTEGSYDRSGQIYVDGAQSGTFTASGDIEEASRAGVHCGLAWEASPRFHYQAEGQFTADSWLLGIGVRITPEQLAPRF